MQFGESGEQIACELEQASIAVWRCATLYEAVKKGRELCKPGRGTHGRLAFLHPVHSLHQGVKCFTMDKPLGLPVERIDQALGLS